MDMIYSYIDYLIDSLGWWHNVNMRGRAREGPSGPVDLKVMLVNGRLTGCDHKMDCLWLPMFYGELLDRKVG